MAICCNWAELALCKPGDRVKLEALEHAYLVESSGDLLQVIREVEWEDVDAAHPPRYYTSTFEVFKLDFSTRTWSQVNDLGGNALFLGHNRSISISTKDFSEFKQDCIYYLDNYLEGYSENPPTWMPRYGSL